MTESLPYSTENEPLWTYAFDYTSSDGRKVLLRALLDTRTRLASNAENTFTLQDVFTYKKDLAIGTNRKSPACNVLLDFLFYQLWKEDLISNASLFLYPSHYPKKVNPVMEQYVKFRKKLFSASYIPDALHRWKPTPDKSFLRARKQYQKISFASEFNSLALAHKENLKDTLIVLDDFTTTGLSLDAARNLLKKTDAERIALCAVGKFSRPKPRYKEYEVKTDFDPYSKKDKVTSNEDYSLKVREVQTDYQAQSKLQKHFKRLSLLLFSNDYS